jgi:hypothetical protein
VEPGLQSRRIAIARTVRRHRSAGSTQNVSEARSGRPMVYRPGR